MCIFWPLEVPMATPRAVSLLRLFDFGSPKNPWLFRVWEVLLKLPLMKDFPCWNPISTGSLLKSSCSKYFKFELGMLGGFMLLSSDAQCSCHAIAHTRVNTFRMRTFYWEPFAASQGFTCEDFQTGLENQLATRQSWIHITWEKTNKSSQR